MTKAVFFGASSVEGAGTSSPGCRFCTLVAQTLGWEEVNLGIGGTTVVGRDDEGQIIDESSGIGRVPEVVDAQPDIILIHYGGNDFGRSLPLGDPEKFQQGTFYWDFDTMLRGLREGLPDAEILLSTIQYRADAATPNALGLTLEDYNRVIRQLGARYDLRVLDAYHDSEITPRNFAALSADAIHLNDAGNERLAAFYIEELKPMHEAQ